MDLCFDKAIYILGVISAFVQKKKLLHALLLGKSTPKTNILDEFSPTILYGYGCCFW
jgi:hypothetical protein